jgi:hypothetical protein
MSVEKRMLLITLIVALLSVSASLIVAAAYLRSINALG